MKPRKVWLPHEVVLVIDAWPGIDRYKTAMFHRLIKVEHTVGELNWLLKGSGTRSEELRDATLVAFSRIMDDPCKYYLPDPPRKDPLGLIAFVKEWRSEAWAKQELGVKLTGEAGAGFEAAWNAVEQFRQNLHASLKQGVSAKWRELRPFVEWKSKLNLAARSDVQCLWAAEHVEDLDSNPFPLTAKDERQALVWFFDKYGAIDPGTIKDERAFEFDYRYQPINKMNERTLGERLDNP